MKKTLKLTRKERLANKIKARATSENDIKYIGILSYRYVRIVAWIAFAMGQVAIVARIAFRFNDPMMSETAQNIFTAIGSLSTPLFIIASFGLILSGRRDYKRLLLSYGAAFFGVGFGFCFFYWRYINGLFAKIGTPIDSITIIRDFLGSRVEVNVFADLFSFLLFHFFMNYKPKKVFTSKKIKIFRLFAIIPVIYVITSYVLKIVLATKSLNLPFYVYPFLTTKTPLVFFIFVVISIWINNRERKFIRFGLTKQQYHDFLFTRRNSLYFSIHLSIIILIFAFIEIILGLGVIIIYAILGYETDAYLSIINAYGLGQCVSLIFAIPIIFLYSYTKNHKNTVYDIFVPVGGIALTAFVYLESIYQFLIDMLG